MPPCRFSAGYSSGNPQVPPPPSPLVHGQYVWQPAPIVYGVPAQASAQPLVTPGRRTATVAALLAFLMALLSPAGVFLFGSVGSLLMLLASILLLVGATPLLFRKFAGSVLVAVGSGFWILGAVVSVVLFFSWVEWVVPILVLIVGLALVITTLVLAFRRSTREWCRFRSRPPVSGYPVYRAY